MSEVRETRVPRTLALGLGPGSAGFDDGFTIQVISESDDGWPHVALVSFGEVVVTGEQTLRVAIWPGASAARHLSRTGRAVLSAVCDHQSWTMRTQVVEQGVIETPLGGELRTFDLRVVHVVSDEAPYAVLRSGITFELTDPVKTRQRWREVRAALGGEAT